MRRRFLASSAVVAALVVGIVGLMPSVSAAGAVDAVGWWTRNPGQSAPAGGIAVAAAPDGPVTVGAVAFDAGDGAASARITAVETGGVGASTATLQVCLAEDGWTPVEGGALADAPKNSCETRAVPFERDADAATWSADVIDLVGGEVGMVSLSIVPAGGDPLAAFDVRFATPVVEVTPIPPPTEVTAPTDGSGFGTDTSNSGGAPASGGSFDFSPAPADVAPSPSFDPAPAPAAEPETPVTVDPATTGDTEPPPEATDDEVAVPLLPTSAGGSTDHRTVGKALTYVGLSALAGIVVGGGSRVRRLRATA